MFPGIADHPADPEAICTSAIVAPPKNVSDLGGYLAPVAQFLKQIVGLFLGGGTDGQADIIAHHNLGAKTLIAITPHQDTVVPQWQGDMHDLVHLVLWNDKALIGRNIREPSNVGEFPSKDRSVLVVRFFTIPLKSQVRIQFFHFFPDLQNLSLDLKYILKKRKMKKFW